MRRLGQPLDQRIDLLRRFVAFDGGLGFLDGLLHFPRFVLGDLVPVFRKQLFEVVDRGVGLVSGFDLLAQLAVLIRVGFGFVPHALDFFLAQAARSGDGNVLLLAGSEVFGRDVDDAVGVNVEGHVNLRQAARGRRDAHQLEFAERPVVPSHGALALQHVDLDRGLVVRRGGELFALAGRDRGVALDQRGHHAAQCLQTERERGHVQQQNVLDVAAQHAGLHRSPGSDHLVRIHAPMRFLAEDFLDDLLYAGNARGASHQHDLVYFACRQPGVLQRLPAGLDGALQQFLNQLLELGPAQPLVEVPRAACVGRDERKIHLRLHHARKLHLGLFRGVLETLQRHLVLREVNPFFFPELLDEPFDDLLVHVVTTQVRIPVGGLHLDDSFAHLQNRDVKGAASEVVDRDGFVFFLVQSVSQGRRRRFVDDSQHFEAGDLSGILGGLPLAVVEIGRNGDDRLLNRLAQVVFGRLFHLLQHHGRDFRRGVKLLAAVDQHAHAVIGSRRHLVRHNLQLLADLRVAPSHEPLDRIYGILGVGDGLALCHLSHQTFPVLREGHHGRRGPGPLRARNHSRFPAFHHRHDGVGGAEVYADYLSHLRRTSSFSSDSAQRENQDGASNSLQVPRPLTLRPSLA